MVATGRIGHLGKRTESDSFVYSQEANKRPASFSRKKKKRKKEGEEMKNKEEEEDEEGEGEEKEEDKEKEEKVENHATRSPLL